MVKPVGWSVALVYQTAYFCGPMLNPKEQQFLKYWEQNRERQKKWFYQLAVGLPLGGILGGLILVNFYSGWYKRADMVANSDFNPMVLYVAVAGIAVFWAVFSRKFQWDQQEKKFRELQARQAAEKESSADAAKTKVQESSNETGLEK